MIHNGNTNPKRKREDTNPKRKREDANDSPSFPNPVEILKPAPKSRAR